MGFNSGFKGLMLGVQVIAVYCEYHKKYLNTLREKLRDLYIVTPCGKCSQRFIKRNPTRCNNVPKSFLFHIYMKLNMFRAIHCP